MAFPAVLSERERHRLEIPTPDLADGGLVTTRVVDVLVVVLDVVVVVRDEELDDPAEPEDPPEGVGGALVVLVVDEEDVVEEVVNVVVVDVVVSGVVVVVDVVLVDVVLVDVVLVLIALCNEVLRLCTSRSELPAPISEMIPVVAFDLIMLDMAVAVIAPCSWSNSATTPETWGAAIEVPDCDRRLVGESYQVETTSLPGAHTSTHDPKLEYVGFFRLRSIAPTVITSPTRPGEYRQASRFRFPAETTT